MEEEEEEEEGRRKDPFLKSLAKAPGAKTKKGEREVQGGGRVRYISFSLSYSSCEIVALIESGKKKKKRDFYSYSICCPTKQN